MTTWMLYGAYGYTGKLIAQEARKQGHQPLLAGRSADKLSLMAEKSNLPYLAIDLSDVDKLALVLSKVQLVLHAAGPFIQTSDPMLQACLKAGVHYVDITGELPVFENTFAFDKQAHDKNIALMSGAGFDVVPTDCLAVYVHQKMPDATSLELAIQAIDRASAGTTKSTLEMMPRGGFVRRDGELQPYAFGKGIKTIRFSHGGEKLVMAIPWGDLSTAYRSTHIPNITTYMVRPKPFVQTVRVMGPILQRSLAIKPLRRLLQKTVEWTTHEANDETRQQWRAYVWAKAANAKGETVEAWLETIEGYDFTAVASVKVVERLLGGGYQGALTPAQAFGADFGLEIEGTRRFDRLP